jgi:putative transposase
MRYLRYRGRRSLGWVPFKASGIKQVNEGFKFGGHIYRVWLSRPVPGRIKCGSFAQDALGHWFINFCIDIACVANCGPGEIGIDLGLKTTATMSNGQKYDGLRAYRAIEPKLAIAQRAHKKKRAKALHAKAKNRGLDGLHKLSTQLVRTTNGWLSKTSAVKLSLEQRWRNPSMMRAGVCCEVCCATKRLRVVRRI